MFFFILNVNQSWNLKIFLILILIIFCADHSRELWSVARCGNLQKRHTGAVTWMVGYVLIDYRLSLDRGYILCRGPLRQNLAVWPKRRHRLHWMGDQILGLISNIMLKINVVYGIYGATNFSSIMRVCMILCLF